MTEPIGRKPVLAEIPAHFDQLTEKQQDRFIADLASQLLGEWAGEPAAESARDDEHLIQHHDGVDRPPG